MHEPVAAIERLIEDAGTLRYEQLGGTTVDRAIAVIADTLAASDRGLRSPHLFRYADRLARRANRDGAVSLLSRPRCRVDAGTAAFAHGCAAVADELDESLGGGGHPAAHVVPAAVAVAQARRRSGPELLCAVVAGYEVAGQLFQTYRPVFPAHPHGFYGALGAAVACAKLAELPARDCAAIVATAPILPGWSPSFAGATARNTQVGLAAYQAVLAIELCEAGFTGDCAAIIEALAKQLGHQPTAAAVEQLRVERPLIQQSILKPHPAAGPLQPALDAAIRLSPVELSDIDEVLVTVPPQVIKFARPPRPNNLSARFSLPYAVAAGLLTRGGTSPDLDYREETAALLALVRVEQRTDATSSTTVELHLRGGAVRSAQAAAAAPWNGVTPLSQAVRAKWRSLADGADDEVVAHSLALQELADCADLFGQERS